MTDNEKAIISATGVKYVSRCGWDTYVSLWSRKPLKYDNPIRYCESAKDTYIGELKPELMPSIKIGELVKCG